MIEFGTLILTALLLQTPSLDSDSANERLDAVNELAQTGRTENIPPLVEALKKEPKGDVRAAIVAGLGRIRGPEVVPLLIQSLQTDLDKYVRLQAVDSLQRLYIVVESKGPIRTIFNKVKSVFAGSDRPVVHDPAAVDPVVNAALAEAMQKDFNQEVRAAAAQALGSLKARDQLGSPDIHAGVPAEQRALRSPPRDRGKPGADTRPCGRACAPSRGARQ